VNKETKLDRLCRLREEHKRGSDFLTVPYLTADEIHLIADWEPGDGPDEGTVRNCLAVLAGRYEEEVARRAEASEAAKLLFDGQIRELNQEKLRLEDLVVRERLRAEMALDRATQLERAARFRKQAARIEANYLDGDGKPL
jgi:hypothetical protein